VSHVGLNVDRWWEELKQLDADDQEFFDGLGSNDRSFLLSDSRTHQVSKQAIAQRTEVVGGGFDLPRTFPQTGTTNNIVAGIVLLNMEVMEHLKASPKERDLLTTEQLVQAHDNMDSLIDAVAVKVRGKQGR
jgi:hypothetical protein